MEEFKRMLEAIHRKNEEMLTILFSMDKSEMNELNNIMNDVDSLYDEIFYGKEE